MATRPTSSKGSGGTLPGARVLAKGDEVVHEIGPQPAPDYQHGGSGPTGSGANDNRNAEQIELRGGPHEAEILYPDHTRQAEHQQTIQAPGQLFTQRRGR